MNHVLDQFQPKEGREKDSGEFGVEHPQGVHRVGSDREHLLVYVLLLQSGQKEGMDLEVERHMDCLGLRD